MALQPKFIACGKSMAAFSMVVRFLIGPAVIAATSSAIRIHGVLFQIIIVQVLHAPPKIGKPLPNLITKINNYADMIESL